MLAASVFLLCSGCQSPVAERVAAQPSARTPTAFVPGDVVRLTFLGAPELTHSQKIRPDGTLSLPLIGQIDAAGKTPRGLQEELGHLYQQQLRNNEVVVTLEASTALVYVDGAVRKPGKVILDRPMTVFEAIMEAGGFDPDYGNPGNVSLQRNEQGKQISRTLDLRPALKGKPFAPYYVRPYDVIFVRQKMF